MKKFKTIIFSSAALATIFLTSCTKEKDPVDPPKTAAKQTDQAASTEVDEAMEQVNDAINNGIGGGSSKMRVAAYNLPCGVVSFDSSGTGTSKTYKLNYGTHSKCGYKYKSGEISFSLKSAAAFNSAGAVFTVTFTNYKVEVEANGSVVTLNGSMSVTNVNGGYVWEVIVDNTKIVKHKVRGNLLITYANNEVRPRNYFHTRTYSNASSGWPGLTLTVAGDSISGLLKISETGKTYENNLDFVTDLSTDFVWANCGTTWAGPYKLKAGKARMNVTVPLVSVAYIDVEAGYQMSLTNTSATPVKVNDCNVNAYKISAMFGTTSYSSYQLY